MIEYPAEQTGGEVQCGSGGEALRYAYRSILGMQGGYGVGGHREGIGDVRHEIKTGDEGHQAYDKCLYYVSAGDGQHHGEEVEHASQGGQRQELIARQDNGQ